MKNAWKYYTRQGWYPTYYACLDKLSYEQNRESILAMVKDSMCLTQKFFLYEPVAYAKVQRIQWGRSLYQFSKDLQNLGDGGNTATNCAQIAAAMGYNHIMLAGIDLSWGSGEEYFIRGYREPGEEMSPPEVEANHVRAWIEFGHWAKREGIMVEMVAENRRLPFRVGKVPWQ